MYLAKNLTGASLPEIGRVRRQAPLTVIHSIRQIEALRRTIPISTG